MTKAIWLTLPALTAGVLSAVLTPFVARLAVTIGAVDLPGYRKIHTAPIPRLGGLAVVASIAMVQVGASLFAGGNWQVPSQIAFGLPIGVLPVFLVSVFDDVRSVSARKKLLAHTIGAVVAVTFGISLGPVVHLFGTPIYIGVLAAPLSVLWIVGVTNAFNIIDGLDGLSAGLALISAAGMAAVFMLVGERGMGGVALVLAGALAGFLPYNMHPARLFLGDTGATAIGFCLAVFALKGGSTLTTGFAALLPVFILGLPIADTFITMARRTLGTVEDQPHGLFSPDRNHIHHRLLALGIDHGKAVLILYGAGLVFACAALFSIFLTVREAGLFVAAILVACFVGVHRLGYDEFAFIRRGTVLKVYEMPTVQRGMFIVFVDIFLAIVTSYLAVGLKTDQWSLSDVRGPVLDLATAFAPVTVLAFWWSGMYRGSWRVASLQDLTRCCRAVAIVTVLGAVLVRMLTGEEHTLSLFAIYGTLSLLLTASLRASYVVLEGTRLRASHQGRPVLVYGAGRRGAAAVRELFQDSGSGLTPIGFIDDDVRKRGRLVSGLPVFGTERELEAIIHMHGAEGLLLSSDKISDDRVEHAGLACREAGARMFRLDIKVERLIGAEADDQRLLSGQPEPLLAARTEPAASSSLSLDLWAPESCPSCAGHEVYRSKARSPYERVRKAHTKKRLFRCHHCGWRGWLAPLDPGQAAVGWEVEEVDLSDVDSVLGAVPLVSGSRDR